MMHFAEEISVVGGFLLILRN